jgi:hypothetical protein
MKYYIQYRVLLRRDDGGDVEDLAEAWVDSRELTHLAGTQPDDHGMAGEVRETVDDVWYRVTQLTHMHLISVTFHQPELPFP